MRAVRESLRIREILGRAAAIVAARARAYAGLLIVVQGIVVLLGVPFVLWLLSVLLDVVGERFPATVNAFDLFRDPVAVGLLLAILLAVGALVFAELTVLLLIAARHQRGAENSWKELAADGIRFLRRLRHRSSLLLIPYVVVLIPFSGFVFTSLFSDGLRVPAALRIQLLSTVPGAVTYFVAAVVALYLNVRLVLTLPHLVSGAASTAEAVRASWASTRRRSLRVLGSAVLAGGTALLLIAGLTAVGLGPTRYADDVAPDWSPGIAVASLTVIELGVFFVVGFLLAILANAAIAAIAREPARASRSRPAPDASRTLKGAAVVRPVVVGAAVLALLAALVPSNIASIGSLTGGENTMVIAHRGVQSSGVENTISGLEAAMTADPDFLEVDVQETRDGQLVLFHDATLTRLAGDPREVRSLTLAELRRIPLRQGDAEDRIATLDVMVERAEELGQALFIELKVRGDESPEFLQNVIDILNEHEVADRYLVASFDKAVIEEFAALAPATSTGYIIRVNLGRVPATTADFLVVNHSSYSPELRDEAWAEGLEILVWTVDDTRAIRDLIRDSVDGIITNRAHTARALQQEIVYETGVASRLEDLLRRTFGW